MAKEVILNTIREVSKFDFVDYPNKKRAPKDAKFKIVFYKPPPKTKTNIPKKFQGVQYFKNKNDAKANIAFEDSIYIFNADSYDDLSQFRSVITRKIFGKSKFSSSNSK